MQRNPTKAEINRAERILFGREDIFDDERIAFINDFDTLDVLAVPGSGKTTALLAKLIILSKYASSNSTKGILVLSHTNAAVDVIRDKIGLHCPNLFRYPNFVGTIQNFVDVFLAAPYFEMKYGKRPEIIDASLFHSKAQAAYDSYFSPTGFNQTEIKNVRHFLKVYEIVSTYRLSFDAQSHIIPVKDVGEGELEVSKPRRQNQRSYTDFTSTEKARIKLWLIQFRLKFWEVYQHLHYDDAYFFADAYQRRHPAINNIIKARFEYVFVDEMQDMDTHQVQLLDKIFYDPNQQQYTFQRIGDKNQSIFSNDIKLDEVWTERTKKLTISKSMRLSTLIAAKVEPFAITPIPLVGANEKSNEHAISPRILLYNKDNPTAVISRFAEIISELQQQGKIPISPKHKFKAIGWRKYADEQRKTIIGTYYPDFNPQRSPSAVHLQNFCECFLFCANQPLNSPVAYNSLTDSILTILKLNDIKINGRDVTRSKLLAYIQTATIFSPSYETGIFVIMKSIAAGNLDEAQSLFKELAIKLVEQMTGNSTLTLSALQFIDLKPSQAPTFPPRAENTFEKDSIQIQIGSVHSVKGETHCATLYLETFYYADAGKSFESQRLLNQFKGTSIQKSLGKRARQSAKVVYVGFSRPTHLLCVGISRENVAGEEDALRNAGWVVEVIG